MVSTLMITLPACFSYSRSVLKSGIDRPVAILAYGLFWAGLLLSIKTICALF